MAYVGDRNEMNERNRPLILTICVHTGNGLYKLYSLLQAYLVGLWLGILGRETLHLLDEIWYDASDLYFTENWNHSGLFGWEKEAVTSYFGGCRRLLVGSAGGGRETLALCGMGFDVDGFECSPQLAAYANRLLESNGIDARVELVPRDRPSRSDRLYEGAVIGWAAYTLIQGRSARVAFLRDVRAQMQAGAPLLLSFFYRTGRERRFKVVTAVGNLLRWLLHREPLELGDDLVFDFERQLVHYVHLFTREQIASELAEAGFSLQHFSTKEYGHAVGIAAGESGLALREASRESGQRAASLLSGGN
jgi:hypothetical protein